MNRPTYLCPRIGYIDYRKITSHQILLQNLNQYHGKYFQIFNLTQNNISLKRPNNGPEIQQTKFKWRGTPFSLSQTIKILSKLEQYMRQGVGHSILFFVNNDETELFARVVVRQYMRLCQWSIQHSLTSPKPAINNLQQTNQVSSLLEQKRNKVSVLHQYFSQQLVLTYIQIKIQYPPIKILSSFQLSRKDYIPLVQISAETRYNQFEHVFSHGQQVQNQLVEYYYNLNKPLELQSKTSNSNSNLKNSRKSNTKSRKLNESRYNTKSTGSKYYDRKPQTKYFSSPIVVSGDVKITCYSFNTIEKKKEFSCGFNTKSLIFSEELGQNQGIVTLYEKDFYENEQIEKAQNQSNTEAYIGVQNWCSQQQCATKANCEECLQMSKKLTYRYNEIQTDLNKLYRQRTVKQVKDYFSL